VVGVQVSDEHALQVVESKPRVGEGIQGAQAAVDLIDVAADLQRRRDSGLVGDRWRPGLDAERDQSILGRGASGDFDGVAELRAGVAKTAAPEDGR
jgi:hypothetical protein